MKSRKIGFGKIGMNLNSLALESKEDKNIKNDGFGSFSKSVPKKDEDMESVMGFSSFGDKKKKIQEFDLETVLAESERVARERNAKNNAILESEYLENVPKYERRTPTTTIDETEVETKKKSDNYPLRKINNKHSSDSENEDSENEASENEEEITSEKRFPVERNYELIHGSRSITALAIDSSGSRLVTGSVDYDVKFWDFAGMDSSLQSFRVIRPSNSHVIHQIAYSVTGDKILVVSGSSTPSVLDRDGFELFECVKGDPYVIDVARNKGHVGSLSYGAWNPKNKEEFMTCGNDSSLRLWSTESKGRSSKTVIKTRSDSGHKTCPTTCSYSRDGLLLTAVTTDGSIQIWDTRKSFLNPSLRIKEAHEIGFPVSCLSFAYDNVAFVTRNSNSLKLWDIRNNKKPVFENNTLFSSSSSIDVCFSPNDTLILTGTSGEIDNKESKSGELVFFERSSFDKVLTLPIASPVIRTTWHPKLNQIFVGCGDGKVRLFYDSSLSLHGAMLISSKKSHELKKASSSYSSSFMTTTQIIVPYSLPLFREERQKSTRRQEEKARKDPIKSKRPELPTGMRGTGGRVSSGGSTLHSWMAKQISVKNKDDHIDPRERILRHAQECIDNPYWITPAYSKTQPKPVFRNDSDEDEPPEKLTKTETFG